MSFTHLHVHTEYSLLDGVNKIPSLLEYTKSLGMNALTISDHGVMYGAAEFWKYSKDFGIKPIIGCEVYLSPKERTLRQSVDNIKYYHLLLLAKDLTGYKNLMKLVTIGQLEGLYYKPRVDQEILKKYSEGIICTSACLAGPLSRHILKNEFAKAEDWLMFLKDTYKENFYLELQRNGFDSTDDYQELETKQEQNGQKLFSQLYDQETLKTIKKQMKVNIKLKEYAKKYNLPLIATTDAHYLKKEDKEVQTILFCIKDGKLITDDKARKGYEGTYILSSEEMQIKFKDDPSVLENTMKIADQVKSYDIGYVRVQPKFWNIPLGITAEKKLRMDAYIGCIKRYIDSDFFINPSNNQPSKFNEVIVELYKENYKPVENLLGESLVNRLNLELKVIHDKGYDDYFLVVADIINWATSKDILIGVRGSASGSVVGHCIGISELEPIKWELYFERFLNPERPSPPDIDIDIQDSKRDEVINYVKEKYGNNSVAGIITFGKLNTKAAIRDVARVMGIDLKIADTLSKKVKVVFGKSYSLDKMMDEDREFASIINSSEKLLELTQIVRKIDKIRRHVSVHACGYLITPGLIVDYVPEQIESAGEGRVIVQYEFPWLEELGLMKFDFLGLRTMSILYNCIKYIQEFKHVKINYNKIPDNDLETYKHLSKGETIGVFQFESPPMQQYLQELKPENQEDLCFLGAAYRPGPMKFIPDYIKRKHGEQEVKYLIPELEPIVGYTYGFAIYQEQVLRIAVDLAGYTLGQADNLRRAMGKKKKDVMEKENQIFKKGVLSKGYSDEIANKLWEYLLPFADYGFVKGHSATYAILAYRCAYLKTHYPLEFVTALMHADLENLDRVTLDIQEARRMGFEVLPPNINKSEVYFTSEDLELIRFGLGAIKNVGTKVCEKIIEERNKNGHFLNLDDLISRVSQDPSNPDSNSLLNKRSIEALIKSGALDEFGDRKALLKIMPEVLQKSSIKIKLKDINQTDLFSFDSLPEIKIKKIVKATALPNVELTLDSEKMEWEKELLGLFITTHPLHRFNWIDLFQDYYKLNNLDSLSQNTSIKLFCIISTVKLTFTKKDNQKMAILALEDLTGKIDAVMFPKVYDKYKHFLTDTTPLIIRGIINIRDEKKSIIINEIEHGNVLSKPRKIELNLVNNNNENDLVQLKSCFQEAGDTEVIIHYGTEKDSKSLKRSLNLEDNKTIDCIKKWVKK